MFINRLFALFICCILSISSALGADFYVSVNGDNSQSGDKQNPWRTVAQANKKLKAGDTVYIKNGEYSDQINPINSGSPGRYITYKAYSSDK